MVCCAWMVGDRTVPLSAHGERVVILFGMRLSLTPCIAPSYLQATAATAGAAAEIADVRKTKTYQDLLKTHHFIPVAMETLGPINEIGITFVADIGRLLTQATDEVRETSFIFPRLSVTIQRFNAVAFAGTLTATLPEFEQRLFARRLHHSRY